MGYLVWTKELETGIEVIDGQHERIVDYINKLHDARLNNDLTAIGDIIAATVDYTLSHFSFEEALIEDAGYEFVRPHKKVHELFIRRVSEFQDRFKNGEDISAELHDLLARWLFNHIRNDDAAYVKAVKINMLEIAADKGKQGGFAKSLKRLFGGK
ncbi:MAG: bacteriohemerythrin [Candidatus Thiodiazotropha lotti]|uniref:Hemerythrin-like domain-containing protein n=1 Tax=Candidatus Thiodiazotropha endoloripes TaxID=1818881 RepID=A0A1E2UL74_9GAMM|nr:bacteriohemerythrin [Candidatus Thiodiazotropha endoloripes]MCG7899407.1 bacteriohemerythrin [Candidatus Thiodiazotropha weberae]MCG7992095.1 bacteriohemerythrin [Candidatus Thiodiazotropha lotti]MCG7903989.1 bacteriohemerythrin [Candidatus Thiodiazotropha weberae]MCG7915503.1 bacteriohemerythrin [Candidatus Thiodiazotropha weberae]MCG7998599.1 bacteriohemerythrin [Candidatus Thiodiazotropha lotti]